MSSVFPFFYVIAALTSECTAVCYPFQDRDPFILTRTPHVYFIGNQPTFATRRVASERDDSLVSRVILIPKFSESGEVIILNCKTLECKVICFA